MKKILLSLAFLAVTNSFAGAQFAMSDADRAMYTEMLENNPADIFVEEGGELLEKIGGDAGFAEFLGLKEDDLAKYVAGFPRYIEKLGMVVGTDQVLQALMAQKGQKPYKLKSKEMFAMSSYVKSLANEEKVAIDVNADEHIKQLTNLVKKYMRLKEVVEV